MPTRLLAVCAALSLSMVCSVAASAAEIPVKVGVLTDMSGWFADASGPGAVLAAKLAAKDAAQLYPALKIEIVSADHQSKVDIGSTIARKWFETEGVDTIIDLTNSAIGIAVWQLAAEKGKITMSTAGTSQLTEKLCSKTGVQWAMDSYTYSKGVTQGLLKTGKDTWFFITVDYAGGHAIESAMTDFVKSGGGTVLSSVRHPVNSRDFASFLLAAQSSKAKAIGIANGGADTIDTIKQAHEFGLVQSGVALAAPVFFITDVHALGLDVSQGVRFVSPFYWDRTDATRAWAARFFEEMKKMPTHLQAGDYTFLMHYFKAVAAVGGTESGPVMAKMRETPIDDFMTVNGKLRENGSVLRQRLLLEVKAPNESKKPWDYANVVQEMSIQDSSPRPLNETNCPLLAAH